MEEEGIKRFQKGLGSLSFISLRIILQETTGRLTLTIRMGQGRKGGVELKDFLRANKSWKENSN